MWKNLTLRNNFNIVIIKIRAIGLLQYYNITIFNIIEMYMVKEKIVTSAGTDAMMKMTN